MPTYFDIGVVLNRSWCVQSCPTGFNDVGAPVCTPSAGDMHIMSYNFISAFDTIPNAITAITNDLFATVDGVSGLPGTGRGYYFNGVGNAFFSFGQ
jgi:hypothetical protein